MPSDRELRSIDLDNTQAIPDTDEQVNVNVNDPTVLLIEQVRQAYILCYRAFKDDPNYGVGGLPAYDGEGGRNRWGRRNPQAIWPRLARQVLKTCADPVTFVHAQFHAASRGRAPTPQMMLGERSEEQYRTYAANAVEELKRKLESDRASVQSLVLPLIRSDLRWDESRALKHALFNVVAVSASPLFRLCLGLEKSFDDVVHYFYGRGLIQYAFQQRAYDEAWGEIIPPLVRADGTTLRVRMLG